MRWDWKAVLGIAVSAILIWWVLRGVDLGQVWTEIRGAHWGLLLAAIAVATSGFAVRAMRWKLLLHPLRAGTGFRSRFAAVNIGFSANNLLPARVGEFARAWSISRMEPVTASGAFGTLVVERFLDAIAVCALILVAVLHPDFPTDATIAGRPLASWIAALAGLLGGLLVLVLILLFLPGVFLRIAGAAPRFLPGRTGERFVAMLEGFLSGLDSLRNPRLLAGALVWSFGFWGWNAVSFWLAFHAFGIDQGYAAALFVQGIIALGVAVPSAPGFFGTFHAAAVVALQEVFGVASGPTLAFAFGYHLGGFVPVTLMGLWYAGQLGITLSDLGHADERVDAESAGPASEPGPTGEESE
ncbi:MAG: lysylphosphatidylglycerol synthase transmembrane domain-containing protein [Gemmatimonadota bacterium]